MTISRPLTGATITVSILGFMATGWAQSSSSVPPTDPASHSATCRQQVTQRLTDVVDEYHQILYGSSGSVLTPDGKTVLKLGGTRDADDRPGIFETKGRLTSELIPPLLESYRVLRCNMRSVCEQLNGTLRTGVSADTMKVEPLGCAERELPKMDACTYTNEPGVMYVQELASYCTDVINKTLPAERAALTLAVAYDATYRSNLQTTGMFDSFITLLPKHLFRPLQQMVGLLGKLHQVPCFLTQCDMPPKP